MQSYSAAGLRELRDDRDDFDELDHCLSCEQSVYGDAFCAECLERSRQRYLMEELDDLGVGD